MEMSPLIADTDSDLLTGTEEGPGSSPMFAVGTAGGQGSIGYSLPETPV